MLESPVENFKEQSSKIRVGIAGGDGWFKFQRANFKDQSRNRWWRWMVQISKSKVQRSE